MYGLSALRIAASNTTAVSMYRMVAGSQVLSIKPSAIPAAGGCSVSVATMTSIAIPTDIAPNIAMVIEGEIGRVWTKVLVANRCNMIPTMIPTM